MLAGLEQCWRNSHRCRAVLQHLNSKADGWRALVPEDSLPCTTPLFADGGTTTCIRDQNATQSTTAVPLLCSHQRASLQSSSVQQYRHYSGTVASASVPNSAPSTAFDNPLTQSELILNKTSDQLTSDDISSYYQLRENLIPEASRAFHQAFYPPRPPGKERKGGCKGLQAELDAAGRPTVMYRRCIHEMRQLLATQPGVRLLLAGPLGSGKSLVLAALVEWARGAGWLAMYVPSATALTAGGYFIQRGATGLYDTPISAQHILKGVHDAHKKELEKLPRLMGARQGTLADLALAGLSTDNAAQAVDACLTMRDELAALSTQRPVLLAVDDYNALHWTTDYGRHFPGGERRLLRVEDLTLASGLRLLAADVGDARVVCATTCSRAISPQAKVPIGSSVQEFHVPRYSEVEMAHALAYYHAAGLAPTEPSESLLRRMHALTNGNAAELRRLVPRATALEMGVL